MTFNQSFSKVDTGLWQQGKIFLDYGRGRPQWWFPFLPCRFPFHPAEFHPPELTPPHQKCRCLSLALPGQEQQRSLSPDYFMYVPAWWAVSRSWDFIFNVQINKSIHIKPRIYLPLCFDSFLASDLFGLVWCSPTPRGVRFGYLDLVRHSPWCTKFKEGKREVPNTWLQERQGAEELG